jgi:hypothetical protein
MTLNQKRAWGNVIVWGSYIVASSFFLTFHRTVFFWQEDTIRTGFYAITGAAVVAWFIMMFVVWLGRPQSAIVADERDNEIMSRVNAVAGPIAMTSVGIISLVLMITYLKDKSSFMSPYFLIYIVMVNVVVYWLAQSFIALIAYRRS